VEEPVEERAAASEDTPTAAAPTFSAETAALREAEEGDTGGEGLTAKLHRERLERAAAQQLQSHPLADELPLVIAFGKQSFKVRARVYVHVAWGVRGD